MKRATPAAVVRLVNLAGFVLLVGATFAPFALAKDTHVHVQSFAFNPTPLRVTPGDVVTWHNHDASGHTATSDDGRFPSGALDQDGTHSATFTEVGTYDYHCAVHPSMRGRVVVAANAPPVLALTEPSEGATVTGEARVAGTATDPDGDAVTVEVRIDGGEWRVATGAASWSLRVDSLVLADGEHTVQARAVTAGATTESAARTFVVANAAQAGAAGLRLSNLTAAAQVRAADVLNVTALVANDGDDVVDAQARLLVDGASVLTRAIRVPAHDFGPVTFAYFPPRAGTINVTIGIVGGATLAPLAVRVLEAAAPAPAPQDETPAAAWAAAALGVAAAALAARRRQR